MSYSRKVELKRFSPRYIGYYNKCLKNQVNCLEGAYRAGKSVINIYSFANHLEYCRDRLHLVSGQTAGRCRENVSDCNGIGLRHIFRGRCKNGKHEGNDCLKINSKSGEKIVLFVEGSKSDSYKSIQGLSFGSWLAVELQNHYISSDEKCFIDMALSRLTQSLDYKVWWDLNPTYPTHKIYTKYLDKYLEQQQTGAFYGGYNYMHCTLFDNTALTEEQRMTYLAKYPDKESVEYQRGVLGNRAVAEGIIFMQFAKDKARWVVNDLREFLKGKSVQFISIGVDFGGNGSNTTFVASVLYDNFHGVCPIADDMLVMKGGNVEVKDFRERLKMFLLRVVSMNIAPIRVIFGDSADVVMCNEIASVLRELRMANVPVAPSQKHTIKARIDAKKVMMATGHWFVYKDAKNVINSTATQVWDSREGHEDERLDDGTADIDTADAEEYSWSAYLQQLLVYCR